MKPGREMDALVAEKVMGETLPTEILYLPIQMSREQIDEIILPHYSTDIAAAWLVLEEMREKRFYIQFKASRACAPSTDSCTERVSSAICIAALKAVGVEVEANV